MKLHNDIKMNGKLYKKGDDVPAIPLYGFFIIHMLAFGLSGFFLAYSSEEPDVFFLYIHGGIAIFSYITFYLSIFGVDAVKWLFINSALGIYGIWAEVEWMLSFFDRSLSTYPIYVHVIPFLYYILYTFLLRQILIDVLGARDNPNKERAINMAYCIVSAVIYTVFHVLPNRV